ncbi:hypothetical protein BH10BAC6_BH10BAC6_06630 [soil metagenome]
MSLDSSPHQKKSAYGADSKFKAELKEMQSPTLEGNGK